MLDFKSKKVYLFIKPKLKDLENINLFSCYKALLDLDSQNSLPQREYRIL